MDQFAPGGQATPGTDKVEFGRLFWAKFRSTSVHGKPKH